MDSPRPTRPQARDDWEDRLAYSVVCAWQEVHEWARSQGFPILDACDIGDFADECFAAYLRSTSGPDDGEGTA